MSDALLPARVHAETWQPTHWQSGWRSREKGGWREQNGWREPRAAAFLLAHRPTSRPALLSKEEVNGILGFSDGFARADGGPTQLTQHENFKIARYTMEMNRGAETGRRLSGGSSSLSLPKIVSRTDQGDHALDLVAPASPEAFAVDCQAVDHLLEDMSRNLRLEHLSAQDFGGDQDAKVQKEVQAAKRRKEEVARRARKKDQRARDATSTVSQKIESKRKGEDVQGEEKVEIEIPLLKFSVGGHQPDGRPKPNFVTVVDTRRLQNKCMLMNEGPVTVQRLLYVQSQRQRRARLRRSLLDADTPSDIDSPPLSPSGQSRLLETRKREARSSNDASFFRLPATWEARLQNAQHVKCRHHLENIMMKLNKTRGLEGKLKMELKEELGGSLEKEGMSHARVKALMADDPGQAKHSHLPLGHLEQRKTVRCKTLCLSNREQARHSRAGQRLSIFRSAVQLILLLNRVIRKSHSIKLVKAFCLNIGEWARIRNAIHRMITSVRILQKMFRAWIFVKKKHCEQLAKEWQRIEDHALMNCFKQYAQAILEELQQKQKENHLNDAHLKIFFAKQVGKGRLGRTQLPLSQIMQHLNNAGSTSMEHNITNLVDWKAYRVPAEIRRQAINSFYMKQLKRHVRLKRALEDTIKAEVQNHMEINQYLKQFGTHQRSTHVMISAPARQIPDLPQWWEMSEDKCLEMIASAAQLLAADDVEPFAEHPVNRDFALASKAARGASGAKSGEKVSRLEFPSQRPSKLGLKKPDVQGNKRVDMDDVLRRFTPRLRQISEGNLRVPDEDFEP
mmetsp:Transcript_52261/g.122338  ORF Transcript_52261/g.122338 Transcript_52261/m.122338 type:complete len:792 (+) Transcript_52261:35-2410(+)